MTIKCTIDEYARLVRACAYSEEHYECAGCVFGPFCSKGEPEKREQHITASIEGICEVVADG